MNKLRLSLGVLLIFAVQPVWAQVPTTAAVDGNSGLSNPSGWSSIVPIDCIQDEGGCDICEVTKILTNAANLISAVLSALALLMFIVGGLFWIFSGGNEQRIETGKKIIIGTISGLAVVFIAWFAVNLIVRTASLSGGSSTAVIFSDEWWKFEGCYPSLPTTCDGEFIGDACGFNDCAGGSYEDPRCKCWRAKAAEGEPLKCTGENVDLNTAKNTTDTNYGCYCADSCSLLAATTGQAYACTIITESNASQFTIRQDVVCADSSKVCAKPQQ